MKINFKLPNVIEINLRAIQIFVQRSGERKRNRMKWVKYASVITQNIARELAYTLSVVLSLAHTAHESI
jgi:hypothetical protein